MFPSRRVILATAFAITVLAACTLGQAPPAATPDPYQLQTQVALTVAAYQAGGAPPTSVPSTAPPSPAASPAPPTATILPPTAPPPSTGTPVPSPTSTPTATATPIPCNWALFIQDVTYPDDSEVPAGAVFTKTWRLKNIGSCPWTTGYALVFDHGDRMNAPADVNFTTAAIMPGHTVDISVALTAPTSAGTYQGYFKLRSPDGTIFGIGDDHNHPFWVRVKVNPPTPTATPTATSTSASPVTVTLDRDAANSGTIYEDYSNTIGGTVIAGDTSSDLQARGYLTYDLSGIPATVTEAHLNLMCSQVRNPLSDLSGIWLAEVEFALPLGPLHYDVGGSPITLLTAPLPATVNVTSQVQADLTSGDPYFQIRMHPQGLDHDGQADYLQCTNTTLTITYQP